MTRGLAEPVPPVLVLGVGNSLLSDDGAGLRLLNELRDPDQWPDRVEWVDGGTQGIALLGVLSQRRAAIILDAVRLGSAPGTVYVLGMDDLRRFGAPGSVSAHEGNALQLLGAAELIGELPEHVTVVGIEPASIRTGVGLSPPVEASLPHAKEVVLRLIGELV
jgi:hydrogenase maturation protease